MIGYQPIKLSLRYFNIFSVLGYPQMGKSAANDKHYPRADLPKLLLPRVQATTPHPAYRGASRGMRLEAYIF